ncbi:DsbA family protein [Herbiconiux sp. A18JL235]|uniref:DsbA family protein n=1 Tax=Herbiconiux sp. A18JL235 TaxID=3152363 RepID=A0AB39BIR9_9MICO
MSPAKSEKDLYDGLSKKDRQALSRELARIKREEERARRRRNRILFVTGSVVVAVAILAGVGFAVYNGIRATFVGPANMLSDGVLFTGDGSSVSATTTDALQPGEEPIASELDTSQVLRLTEYVDYASADVSTFETTNGAALQGYVSAGYASLELHPVALEGPGSYAARAANAFACVANGLPNAALVAHNALVAAQPTLPDGGLSNDELVKLMEDAGITDDGIASCIRGDEFSDWVTGATDRAKASIPNSDVTALSTVPLLVVDGTAYTGALDDTEALNTFITEVFTEKSAAAAGDGTTEDGATDGGTGTEGSTPAPSPAPAG